VTVDLQHGIETAAAQLDRLRPRTVVLAHGREIVATVPLRAGYERLCGGHLRRLLARDYALPYERALGRAGLIPPILAPAALEHDDAPDDTPQRSTAA